MRKRSHTNQRHRVHFYPGGVVIAVILCMIALGRSPRALALSPLGVPLETITVLQNPLDAVFGPDGDLYVSSFGTNSIAHYNGVTGNYIDDFVPANSGGLDDPRGLAFGPDGNLYVASLLTASILRYDGQTGAFIPDNNGAGFVPPGSGGLSYPGDIVFDTNVTGSSRLYVIDRSQVSPEDMVVLRYDGQTGAFIPDNNGEGFIPPSEGLDNLGGLTFDSAGNLYVSGHSSAPTASGWVVRFDQAGNRIESSFTSSGVGGLDVADGLAFGPDGNLYVSDHFNHVVLQFNGQSGAFIEMFTPDPAVVGHLSPEEATAPHGLVFFSPDASPPDLYVVNRHIHQVKRYDGATGDFVSIFAEGEVVPPISPFQP